MVCPPHTDALNPHSCCLVTYEHRVVTLLVCVPHIVIDGVKYANISQNYNMYMYSTLLIGINVVK